MILSAVLHLWRIDTVGNSNAYYTAAVEAMTQSWHNFFYAAAEPGGSVTVDKPPLGLQIETLFALLLGVSGFSTVLPNILAGVFSVPLLYHLVKKHFGVVAGLVAALVMATTPVVFVADRNNTQDGLLTFVLLLAAWAFIKAVETGRARWLFLGAVIVGLGFNIKMLQAYLPVPAFFALYFLGSKDRLAEEDRSHAGGAGGDGGRLTILGVVRGLCPRRGASLHRFLAGSSRHGVDHRSQRELAGCSAVFAGGQGPQVRTGLQRTGRL